MGRRKLVEQGSQAQEQGDDDRLQETAHDEVLLRIPGVLAGQRALHHVLVQPRHGDDREQSAQQLFPEILRMVHVVEEENFLMDPDSAEVLADEDDAQGHSDDHAHGFEDIGPDDRFHPAPVGIGETDAHVAQDVQPEGQPQRFEQQQLQRQAHEEQADGRPQHLGQEEEPRPRPVGTHPEPLLQVLVDGHDVQAEIQRREHEGDDQIAQEKADAHLQVAESARPHHAGHGHVGDPRHAGADHGDGDDGPVRLAAAGIENILSVLLAAGQPGDDGHRGEIR